MITYVIIYLHRLQNNSAQLLSISISWIHFIFHVRNLITIWINSLSHLNRENIHRLSVVNWFWRNKLAEAATWRVNRYQYEIGFNRNKMYSICKFLFIIQTTLVLLAGIVHAFDKYKVIETDNGLVRGVRNTTLLNGVLFYSFRGIPYAKAPIGDLRFKVSLQ